MVARSWIRSALVIATSVAASMTAAAQGYPSKPITLVVPFAPGGPTDASARIVAKGLAAKLGQQVIVENKAGAGGTVAPVGVARAPADGYTLLWAGTSSMAMGPALYRNLTYDPVKSFTPISLVVRSPHMLVGRADLPAASIKEMMAYAKANPGKLSYGSAGGGSSTHLTGELFKSVFGVDLLHVGYKGAAPALTDLLSKQIDLLFDAEPLLLPHVKTGAVKALAMTGAKRSAAQPDLPTIEEALGQPFTAYSWFGLVAPAGTPSDVTAKLTTELRAALADPDVTGQLVKGGFEVLGTTSEVYGQMIKSELDKWTQLVKQAGIRLE